MKKIALSKKGKNKNKFWALVDNDDFEELNKYRWYVSRGFRENYYAVRTYNLHSIKYSECMHRKILKAKAKEFVDHKDGNGLNNQRANIRICTKSENAMNVGLNSKNKTGFKGVVWDKDRGQWRTTIRVGGKYKFLGRFYDKKEAAVAYNRAAIKYFGEFANINKI